MVLAPGRDRWYTSSDCGLCHEGMGNVQGEKNAGYVCVCLATWNGFSEAVGFEPGSEG